MAKISQKPVTVDLEFVAGDDIAVPLAFSLKDSAGVVTPLNLTGCTVRGQIRNIPGASQVGAEFSFTVIDAAGGKVVGRLTSTQTAPLNIGAEQVKKAWDVEVVDTAGAVRTYLAGTVTVLPQVTHG